MLKRDEFVKFILEGSDTAVSSAAATERQSALPSGFEGFETKATHAAEEASSFARRLLEASGFGPAQYLEREEVILGGDASAKHLPDRVYYWPKTNQRPYQTILFELDQSGTELLQAPLFRPLKGQEILEDALSRLVQMALVGFERGGEKRTAAVKQGRQTETLCVVSVHDDREDASAPPYLVCLGTVSAETDALETYHIREAARRWERPLAEDHLTRLYDRHFSKLDSARWQDAFISGEERKLAEKLLEACTGSTVSEKSIQNKAIALLEVLARGFGLRRKPNHETRLTLYSLPPDHDIGADAEALEAKKEANPFKGVALRDEGERLLGYIIYCVNGKKRADELRAYLAKNNRFHNVLVIYPSGREAILELWQGQSCLEGKLTQQGARFEGAGKTVNLLSRFFVVSRARMKNPKELAEELAYRARYLRRLALRQLGQEKKHDHLRSLHEAFKESLVHDQTEDQFADAYAQTITYGLLAGRWISKDELAASGERFTRENALKYVQRTSPFLREFFKEVLTAGAAVKLTWLRDDIIDLLARADIDAVFGAGDQGSDQSTDPVIHFYEPFLAAFDKQTKVQRGVFYTPRPVVSYIVRSVHEILQAEFGLEDGLASTVTWGEICKRITGLKIPDGVKPSEPFVTILDPATGTATFLVEVIDVIQRTLVAKWNHQGLSAAQQHAAWNDYVPKHLLPRLHGYELMVAPYAIAHMKFALKLTQSGYRFGGDGRAHIYLTNALELPVDDKKQHEFEGWAPALAHEAQAVNAIKRRQRFTVVIGNPPYSKLSANLEPEHRALVEKFKFVNGERIHERGALQFEKNLNDDYVKFIALAEAVLGTVPMGVLGFITNHAYLDNPTLRGLRWSLLQSFSQLEFLDLHGSLKKIASAGTAEADDNVFDIQQGVAIAILRRIPSTLAQPVARHADLWGSRYAKYRFLANTDHSRVLWTTLCPTPEHFYFVALDAALKGEYETGVAVTDVFSKRSAGIISARDKFAVQFSSTDLLSAVQQFRDDQRPIERVCDDLQIPLKKGWDAVQAQRILRREKELKQYCQPILYRPFDYRVIFYHPSTVWSMARPVMRHMFGGSNLGLTWTRPMSPRYEFSVLCTRGLLDQCAVGNKSAGAGISYLAPLYLMPPTSAEETGTAPLYSDDSKALNFNASFLGNLSRTLDPSAEARGERPRTIRGEDILSFVYAQLYSPTYRDRYSEFLSRDIPRVFLTSKYELFSALVDLGSEMISLHLLEAKTLDTPITALTGGGAFQVEDVSYSNQTVWLDKGQGKGFRSVPEAVWNFHVGGYHVCEKWLKDRKGRTLSKDDIAHYQKIVVALHETIRLMMKIDEVIDQHGGWPGAFSASEAKPA